MNQSTHAINRNNLDPRVIRTRRLLIDSFNAIRKENKSLRSISVKDITERAGVNRVTFYAHFIDKYELLNVWKRDMFRAALSEKLVADNVTFETLISVILDFVATYNSAKKPSNKQYEPLIEAAIQQEIKDIIIHILRSRPGYENKDVLETVSSYVSWAIFGSANEWSRHSGTVSKQVVARQLLDLTDAVMRNRTLL